MKTVAILLGSAQDGGVPQMGMANNGLQPRTAASLAILDSTGRCFLIDASPDLRYQQRRLLDHAWYASRTDRAPFDGLALTHAHVGHYSGLVHFGREVVSSNDMPAFVTPRMAGFLSANQPWQALVVGRNLALRPVEPGATFEPWPGVTVRSVAVPHRAEFTDTVGYSISVEATGRTAFYLPDIDSWAQWDAGPELAKHDLSILDASFYSGAELPHRDMGKIPHPIVTDTVERYREYTGEHTIVLTHLNHTNPLCDPDSLEAREVRTAGFEIAEDMMELAL